MYKNPNTQNDFVITAVNAEINTDLAHINAADVSNTHTIIINKAPVIIRNEDLEPTDAPLIFTLSNKAASHGLHNLTIDYNLMSSKSIFGGPAIIYDDKPGSITFSRPADNIVNYKFDTRETLGNTDEIV